MSEERREDAHLRTTLSSLPLLVPDVGNAELLSGNAVLLLQRLAESASGDLRELVVAVHYPFLSVLVAQKERKMGTYVKTDLQAALIVDI